MLKPDVHRVALIGATGFIGQRVLRRALNAGHSVRVLARRPDKVLISHAALTVLSGDAHDPQALAQLVAGVDTVITTAGPPLKGRHGPAPFEQAARALVDAATNAGARRLIAIAGAAARLPGEVMDLKRWMLRLVLEKFVMPDVIRTKDLEVAAWASPLLDWTIVRPPRVHEGKPLGGVRATDSTLAGVGVDVEDLAAFIVEAVTSREWVRRAPTVASSGNPTR